MHLFFFCLWFNHRALKRLEAASDLKSHAEQLQQELTAARADYVAMETKVDLSFFSS